MRRIVGFIRGNRHGAFWAWLAVVGSLSTTATVLPAQQADEEPVVLRVGTRLVQLNVVVSDDNGPVEDLTIDDFRVLDDGVEREIAVVDEIRPESDAVDSVFGLPETVVSNRLDRRGRRLQSATVILIDRLNTLGPDQVFMTDQVEEFLAEAADGDERVAVVELSDSGLTVLSDFTADPAAVRNALENNRPSHSLAAEASIGSVFRDGGLDPALAEFVASDPELAEYAELDLESGAFYGQDLNTAQFERLIQSYYVNHRILQTAAALEMTARHLAELPGRRNLIWIAAEFLFPYEPWQDYRFNQSERIRLPAPILDRIDDVFRVIVDNDVAVYPIQALGVVGQFFEGFGGGRDVATELRMSADIPFKIAEVTGGRASFNTNGLVARMRESVRHLRASYSLGFYVPEVESDADFHELEVRVDRQGVNVLHRSGYFGFGSSVTSDLAPDGLDQALRDPFDATGLGLFATAEPSPDGSGVYTIMIAADTNDLQLTREGDDRVGSLEVAMSYFIPSTDENLRFPSTTHPIRLTEAQYVTAEQLMGVVIRTVVETEGYFGHLRVALQDLNTGMTGSLWLRLGDE